MRFRTPIFDGALMAVQQGKADFAAAGVSVTEDREKTMDFTVEYATSKQVVVVNKNAGRIASKDEITQSNYRCTVRYSGRYRLLR